MQGHEIASVENNALRRNPGAGAAQDREMSEVESCLVHQQENINRVAQQVNQLEDMISNFCGWDEPPAGPASTKAEVAQEANSVGQFRVQNETLAAWELRLQRCVRRLAQVL